MAMANNAVLLSFMGKAPYFLFFMPVFFCDPAIGLELIHGIANVCRQPNWQKTAKRLREGGTSAPRHFWLIGYFSMLTPEKTLRPNGLTLNPSILALSGWLTVEWATGVIGTCCLRYCCACL
ncbi:hypothetical protein D3C76_832210 [compost metagenome]